MKNSQKRFVGAMLATSSVLGVVAPSVTAMASVKDETEADIHELRDVINENLPRLKKDPKFSTFHKILYAADRLRIYHNLSHEADRVMDEIGVYSKQVHKPEIISVIDKMNKFSEAKKMEMYDELLEKDIPALAKIDADAAEYLTERLDSWGMSVIFEYDVDYAKATDAIMKVTKARKDNKKSEALTRINEAKKAIKKIKTFKENGEYLNAKLQVEIDLVNKMSSGSSGGGGGSSVGVDVRDARDAVSKYENYVKDNIESKDDITLAIITECQKLENDANKAVEKLDGSEKDALNKTIQDNKDEVIKAGAKTDKPEVMQKVVSNADNKAFKELNDSKVQDAIINKVIANQEQGQDIKNQEAFNEFVNEAIKDVAVDYADKVKSEADAKTVLEIVKSVDEDTKGALSKLEEGVTEDLIAQELLAQLAKKEEVSPESKALSKTFLGRAIAKETEKETKIEFGNLKDTIKEIVNNVNVAEVAVKAYEAIDAEALDVTDEGVEGVQDIRAKAEKALKKIKTVDVFNKRIQKHKDVLERVRDLVKEVNDSKAENLIENLKALGADAKEYNKNAYLNGKVNQLTNKKAIIDKVKTINVNEETAIINAIKTATTDNLVDLLKDLLGDKVIDENKGEYVKQLEEFKVAAEKENAKEAIGKIVTDTNKKVISDKINKVKSANSADDLINALNNLGIKNVNKNDSSQYYKDKDKNINFKDVKTIEDIQDKVNKINREVEVDFVKKVNVINTESKNEDVVTLLSSKCKQFKELVKDENDKEGKQVQSEVADIIINDTQKRELKGYKDVDSYVDGKIKYIETLINDINTKTDKAEMATELGKLGNADFNGSDKKESIAEKFITNRKETKYKTLGEIKEALTIAIDNVKDAEEQVKAEETIFANKVNAINAESKNEDVVTLLSSKCKQFKELVKDENDKEGKQVQSEVADIIINDTQKRELKGYKDVDSYVDGKIKYIETLINDINTKTDKAEMATELGKLGNADFNGSDKKESIAENFITNRKETKYKTLGEIKEALTTAIDNVKDAEIIKAIKTAKTGSEEGNLVQLLQNLFGKEVALDSNKVAYEEKVTEFNEAAGKENAKESIKTLVDQINNEIINKAEKEVETINAIKTAKTGSEEGNLVQLLQNLFGKEVALDSNRAAYEEKVTEFNEAAGKENAKESIKTLVDQINNEIINKAEKEAETINAIKTATEENLVSLLSNLLGDKAISDNGTEYVKQLEGFKAAAGKENAKEAIGKIVTEINNKVTKEAELKAKIEAVNKAKDSQDLIDALSNLKIKDVKVENKDAYYKEEGENKNINFNTLDTVEKIQDKVNKINEDVKVEAVKNAGNKDDLLKALKVLDTEETKVVNDNNAARYFENINRFKTAIESVQDTEAAKTEIINLVDQINTEIADAKTEKEKVQPVNDAKEAVAMKTALDNLDINGFKATEDSKKDKIVAEFLKLKSDKTYANVGEVKTELEKAVLNVEEKDKVEAVKNAGNKDDLLKALIVLDTEETKVVNDNNAARYFENINRFKEAIENAENTEAAKTEIINLVKTINKEITDSAKPENAPTTKLAIIKDDGKVIDIPSAHENPSENTTLTVTTSKPQQ